MNLNEYITSDFYEAVVLKYFSHKLKCVDKTQYRARFSFVRQENTNEIVRGYSERLLKVEPYGFSICVRELKDKLYN